MTRGTHLKPRVLYLLAVVAMAGVRIAVAEPTLSTGQVKEIIAQTVYEFYVSDYIVAEPFDPAALTLEAGDSNSMESAAVALMAVLANGNTDRIPGFLRDCAEAQKQLHPNLCSSAVSRLVDEWQPYSKGNLVRFDQRVDFQKDQAIVLYSVLDRQNGELLTNGRMVFAKGPKGWEFLDASGHVVAENAGMTADYKEVTIVLDR